MQTSFFSTFLKWVLTILSGLITLLEPTFPFILICLLAILLDAYSAFRLSKRVKLKTGKGSGKFRSNRASKILVTMIEMFAIVILAYLVDTKILVMFNGLYLANYVSFAFCFVQCWSILENESSQNDKPWAKTAQRIMVDKTERHFDIDLHEFKDKANATN